MVACVCIEGFDAILTILHQTNGQVLVSQRDVIREVVNAGICADELARLWIIVSALVKQDFVELDGLLLCRVAAGDPHREGRFRQEAATLADPCSTRWPSLTLVSFLPVASRRTKRALVSVLTPGASFPCGASITSASNLTCRANSAFYP